MTGAWLGAFLFLWILVLLLAVAVIGLYRQIVPLLLGAERGRDAANAAADSGLPVGSLVPEVTFLTGSGQVTLAQLTGARAAAFVFLDEGCTPCRGLVAELQALRTAGGTLGQGELFLVLDRVVEIGAPEGVTVLGQQDGAASRALAQVAFPQAFVVERSVVVRRAIPNTVADLRQLLVFVGNHSVDPGGPGREEVSASGSEVGRR